MAEPGAPVIPESDLAAIAKQDFSIRQQGPGLVYQEVPSQSESEEEELPQIPDALLQTSKDHDYAPKSKSRRKKNSTKTKKKRDRAVEHGDECEEESDRGHDHEAYFNGTAPRLDANGDDVFCICRRGDLGKWMIGCDGCDEWYHGECVNVSKKDERLMDKFFCPRCEKTSRGSTTWKRKCRLPGCREPALEKVLHPQLGGAMQHGSHPSKYCSQEHGLEFFQLRVSQALISRREIVSLLVTAGSDVSVFKTLGDAAPPLPASDTEKLSSADLERLERNQGRRATVQSDISRLKRMIEFLSAVRDRAMRVNTSLKARKEKEICGTDFRLTLQDSELAEILSQPDFLSTVTTSGAIDDNLCQVTTKKCFRHAEWYQIKLDGYHLDEELLRKELLQLNHDDDEVRLIARRLAN